MREGAQTVRALLLEGTWRDPVRRAYAATMAAIVFLFPFGLVFTVGGLLPSRFDWTASVVIGLNSLATLLSEMRGEKARVVMRQFAFLTLLLYGLESVGIRTGLPFGAYQYTDVLAPSLLGVPVVIPLAWYTTIITSWRLAGTLLAGRRSSRTRLAVTAALFTVALDLVLEPMAAWVSGYWRWSGLSIPPQNTLSWFVFSALAVASLVSGRTAAESFTRAHGGHALAVLGMQWLLFALTGAVNGHAGWAGASAILLLGLWAGASMRPGAPPREERSPSQGAPPPAGFVNHAL
jgi:uncharacterized membrane protein